MPPSAAARLAENPPNLRPDRDAGRWLEAPRNVADVPLWAYQDGKPVGEEPH